MIFQSVRFTFTKCKVHFNPPKVKWAPGLDNNDCTGVREKARCLVDFINFHGLHQYNVKERTGNILGTIISNFAVFDIQAVCGPLVLVDKFHCPLTLSFVYLSSVRAQNRKV